MIANNGNGDIESRDEWQTPRDLFAQLNKIYNFDIDCCANYDNSKCTKFYFDFEKSGELPKTPIAWMNPPFSKAREMFDHFFKVVNEGVAIYRCDNLDNKLWQEVILKKCDWIFFLKGRVNYEGFDGSICRFPSALIGIGTVTPRDIKGRIVWVN